MKTLLKTICESAYHNKENGNLNIYGIFEEVSTAGFPVIHPKIALVQIVEGTPGLQFSFYFDIKLPSGKVLLSNKENPGKAVISPTGRHHLVHNIVVLSLPESGTYSVELHAGEIIESLSFEVKNVAAKGSVPVA